MNRIIILSSLLLILFTGCKKKIETKYESGKLKESYYVTKNDYGKYVRNGDYHSWYENGAQRAIGTYYDDTGVIYHYDEIGNMIYRAHYSTNPYYWRKVCLNDSFAYAEADYTMLDSMKSGPFFTNWKNGNTKSEGTYRLNVLCGKYTEWDESGKKTKEVIYKNCDDVGVIDIMLNQ